MNEYFYSRLHFLSVDDNRTKGRLINPQQIATRRDISRCSPSSDYKEFSLNLVTLSRLQRLGRAPNS